MFPRVPGRFGALCIAFLLPATLLAAGSETQPAFGRRSIPAKQPVVEPARRSAGDPSRLNRVASRRSSLRFGRNTPGIPPSRALSAGRLAGLGAHPGSTTGCYPLPCAPFSVAFRSKYTRASSPGGGSSLTRLVSRAPHRPRRSPGFHHRPLAQERDLDLVITGGRVLDPETGLDAVRDVGVVRNEIVAISREVLQNRLKQGGVLLDASGKVVSPGFIDLHAHGQSTEANRYQAMDGVTTALELEDGVPRIGRYLESRAGTAIVHYGASARHQGLRLLGIPGIAERAGEVLVAESTGAERNLERANLLREANYTGVEDTEAVHAAIAAEIRAGGLGIGMAHQYYPGATHTEIFRVFELAAELDVPIYTHVRDMAVSAVQEVLANALATGASLHIVHLNSSSIHHLPINLALIKGARDAGLDVTTEAYPYTAASAGISSAIFDEGWQEKLRMTYGDIQWQDTGERLTEETFNFFQEEGGTVIFHMMDPEMIELAMRTPFVMVASDGMPYAPGAHPRSAGTFSRVLGRYVRDQGVLSLPDAIKKITLMPAERLQEIAPLMRRKGRIQIGAIADITVFDPDTIIDTANFEDDLSFSEGVAHVVVDGVPVVRDGALVEGVFPGKPLLGR